MRGGVLIITEWPHGAAGRTLSLLWTIGGEYRTVSVVFQVCRLKCELACLGQIGTLQPPRTHELTHFKTLLHPLAGTTKNFAASFN